MKMRNYITIIILMMLPSFAFAEVSDKLPTINQLWVSGSLVGLIAFLGASYRFWLGIITGLIAVLFCLMAGSTLTDPFVGPAVIKEQGTPYIVAVWGSITLMVLAVIMGFLLNRLKKQAPNQP